jgi:hypothetical protein
VSDRDPQPEPQVQRLVLTASATLAVKRAAPPADAVRQDGE